MLSDETKFVIVAQFVEMQLYIESTWFVTFYSINMLHFQNLTHAPSGFLTVPNW